jgi:nitroreductase
MKALGPKANGKAPTPDTIKLALQAAVLATNLTGDQHWDYYLQCLQGHIEAFREAEAANMELLADTRLVAHDDILRVKMALAEIRATIKALQWAVELPSTIKDDGKKAKAFEVPPLSLTSSP